MFIKNKLFSILSLFLIVVFSFSINTNSIFASTTNGTIDSTYHYAWGENVGWIDFVNVTVSDTALSGSIYGENIGWIDLSTVVNTTSANMGDLSGYAWGENVGWVDFGPSYIGTEGVFYGSIYGENIGWISFGSGNDGRVFTDWRPTGWRPSSIPAPGAVSLEFLSNSGGGGASVSSNYVAPVQGGNSGLSVFCKEGEKFNTVSGLPCTSFTPQTSCLITITLRQGNSGEQVKCLQTKLNTPADGKFGKKTKQAVMVLQKNHDLKADGIVGPATRKVLNSN